MDRTSLVNPTRMSMFDLNIIYGYIIHKNSMSLRLR